MITRTRYPENALSRGEFEEWKNRTEARNKSDFFITINGSEGEGGGAVIRIALALSAVTGKPFRITQIRAKRPRPGLQPQHLTCVKALAEICNAEVIGAELGSQLLTFTPNKIKAGKFRFDIGTAGSVTLLLQALLPAIIHAPAPVEIELFGGTNVAWSPPIEYFQHIFCDALKKFGVGIFSETLKFGFYPKGGGHIKVVASPCTQLKKIELIETGKLKAFEVYALASKNLEKADVCKRAIDTFIKNLGLENSVRADARYIETLSDGFSLLGLASYEHCRLGASMLGERGRRAEDVGQDASYELLREINSGACVDKHLADQLLIYMALAGAGKIKTSEITEHTRTNTQVIEKFLPARFEVKENVIDCRRINE
jgi:RNA 3'-phosphate cyclase